MPRQLIIIDAKNFCYRHHYTRRGLSSKGRPTSVLYGGLYGLLSVATRVPGVPVVFVWDGGGITWRHELMAKQKEIPFPLSEPQKQVAEKIAAVEKPRVGYEQGPENRVPKVESTGYKGQRTETPDHVLVNQQIPIFREFLDKLGFRQFRIRHLEGDDLVAILTTAVIENKLYDEVLIDSTDLDFVQLMSEKVKLVRWVRTTSRTKLDFLSANWIKSEFGIQPKDWLKLRAITGDKSDNIPQILRGVGPKTAAKMVAGGVNPLLETWEEHPGPVKATFGQTFESLWPKVRLNVKLTKLVKQPHAPLSDVLQEKVGSLLSSLRRDSFTRKRETLNDVTFDYMTNFFLDYEMAELFGKRRDFWELP